MQPEISRSLSFLFTLASLHCGLQADFDWLDDDTQLCLADVALEWVGFADPECTRSVVAHRMCGGRPPTYAASDFDPWDNGYSGAMVHLYTIDGPMRGATIYTPECTEAKFTGELWIVGDEITTADGLPTLVMRTE
jgi:hypothetical protein